ncbi:mechanosensitive ion channel domain-containing protein [Rhodopirellula sp. P2]|uniref:mechanosensitive ion channel domain-containing protein n=1 Tax=Rhodopirellula sp. P2 TaxID=2127060 RepID=UPI0023678ECD|nr:mechanosensitive ion channel domain-containing protein [Rhodopirellula sp. P2]WDQ19284.1 mechanosensitive ion channel [Rhodopirellula sp. P2]
MLLDGPFIRSGRSRTARQSAISRSLGWGLAICFCAGVAGSANGQGAAPDFHSSTVQTPVAPEQSILQVAAYAPFQADDSSGTAATGGGATEAPPKPKSDLSSVEAVAAEMESVNNDAILDPMLKNRLLESLKSLQAVLTARQEAGNRVASYEKSLLSIAEEKKRYKTLAAQDVVVKPIEADRYMAIEQIQQKQAEASLSLDAARSKLQKVESDITARKETLEKLPEQIVQTRKEIEKLAGETIGEINDDPDGRLRHVREIELKAKLDEARQRLAAYQQQQTLFESQGDLLPLMKTAAEKELAEAEAKAQAWSATLAKKRQSEIGKDLKDFKRQLEAKGDDPEDSLILSLQERWIRIAGEKDRISRTLNDESAELDKLSERRTKISKDIEENIATSGGLTSTLGVELLLLKNKLPSLTPINARITELRQDIESNRALQTQLELTLEGILDNSSIGLSLENIEGVSMPQGKLSEDEIRLVNKFISDLSDYIVQMVSLQSQLEQKQRVVLHLTSIIDTKIVWIKSQPAFRLNDLVVSWQVFRAIVHPDNLLLLGRCVLKGLLNRPELIAIALIAIFTILYAGARLRRRIATHGERARSRQSVSLKPTLAATLLSWALVLPLVGLLWILGDALLASGASEAIVRATAKAFHLAAVAVTPIELLRQCLRREGLAVAHFGADETSIGPLRKWLRLMIDIGVPLLIFYGIAENLGRWQAAAALSRVMLVLGMILVSVVLWRSFSPATGVFSKHIQLNPNGWMSRLRYIWFGFILVVPLALAFIALIGLSSGARVLVEQLYLTLWLCLLTYYISGFVNRWLLTNRRRLTMAVHRERLEESERLGAGGVEIEPSTSMEASEINAQTTRLLQTILFIVALVGVALVWSPVLPAVEYLDQVKLGWTTTDADGNVSPVTLKNIVFAIPIIVLTWVSVRNLPGLIEGVLLERLPLDKPARYAITTLGTYALITFGILMTAKALGLHWQNIQWLVAALGVGLGFGLQEIFANFVSGLILLFEQPIRVGDVVTLGDTTGVVARIRIRATTVTNWDRQELVIPNKDLITGRLVNWTLTDSTNRIVVNVGVAYGSDTEVACELLRTICDEHPKISKDPGPVVTFEGFGDSTLNLVLRCYLATLDDRLKTIHELHTEINKRFHAAGLEIAFPQRDLHLRSLPPELMERLGASQRS